MANYNDGHSVFDSVDDVLAQLHTDLATAQAEIARLTDPAMKCRECPFNLTADLDKFKRGVFHLGKSVIRYYRREKYCREGVESIQRDYGALLKEYRVLEVRLATRDAVIRELCGALMFLCDSLDDKDGYHNRAGHPANNLHAYHAARATLTRARALLKGQGEKEDGDAKQT